MTTAWHYDLSALADKANGQLEVDLTLPPLEDLGNDFIQVDPRQDVSLHLHVGRFSEGVRVAVSGQVQARGQCVRCLEDLHRKYDFAAEETYFTASAAAKITPAEDEADGTWDGLRVLPDTWLLDLEELVRDEVGTQLPFQPLCQPDCPGLCPSCGFQMKDDPNHRHEVIDDRWEQLRILKEKLENSENE